MKMGSLRAWGCGCAVLVLGVALAGWAEPAERVPAAGVSLMVRRPVAEELLEKLARIPVEQAEPRTCAVEFPAQQARFIRLDIRTTGGNTEPCLDELEVYGPGGPDNLALGARGAVASASSVLAGYAIHAVAHLNDGLYGNDHSWISATSGTAWAQIELPQAGAVSRVVLSRDREGRFRDRLVTGADVRVSLDGTVWQTAATLDLAADAPFPRRHNPMSVYDLMPYFPAARLSEKSWQGIVRYAFLCEREAWSRIPADDYLSPLVTDRPAYPGGEPYWGRVVRLAPLERVLVQFAEMIERLEAQGLDLAAEQEQLARFRASAASDPGAADDEALYLAARAAKRQLFFRDPALAPLERILFAKRHPFLESHNYSEHLDGTLEPGGGLFVLHIPRDTQGRLEPGRAEIEQLFDGSAGIVRDPVSDYDARTVFFAYRPEVPEVEGWHSYWHLYALTLGDGRWQRLTEGPFHDFDPAVLPDGGLAFNTTRCAVRFLCWRPQAYVLHRMERDGSGLQRLSFANLSEWRPSVMSDGHILWTRSEYLDKGADFGHTLWTIRPDGTHPALVFGNNTPNCYSQAQEVPGTGELVCTLMSHGDHHGPIALIDRSRGPFDTGAITNITPDTRPSYQMNRSHTETFRDPYPVSRDHFLVSHNPDRHHNWALYVVDRYGNRELLYVDPEISSKRPSPLCPRVRPPMLASSVEPALAKENLGVFSVQDVYHGLGPEVARGRVKYLRVAEEVPARLEHLVCGQYRDDHPPFEDFYASPIHRVRGPAQTYLTRTANAPLLPLATNVNWQQHVAEKGAGLYEVTEAAGWPSYVAKMSHGVVPVAQDGSASFVAPASRQLYFQLLDGEFNEIQRMRSVIQLQPGEQRSCIGCHEDRQAAPPGAGLREALIRQPVRLEPPPWGAVPFAYEDLVQPVWDRHCTACHSGTEGSPTPDLRGALDSERVPASYRALIEGGWVHYFDYTYGMRHFKAEALSFGTLRSRLFGVLDDAAHQDISLSENEMRAVKAWIDFNCPLWPDYIQREQRPVQRDRVARSD